MPQLDLVTFTYVYAFILLTFWFQFIVSYIAVSYSFQYAFSAYYFSFRYTVLPLLSLKGLLSFKKSDNKLKTNLVNFYNKK